ncbi:MAG: glycosyltransferase family 4 protein [Thermomicrobium sp.]|uniref:glycosyltransferase family 4 protein n=1 Tax=Thermomicrobium sp. TaxID=1969469 RepID=UPI001B19E5BA|nr:glycosyltransferase family 1 protein [Thermomicrobium sp.]MBO9358370.1 glycosyltransferase family 4 protein [Thermomicrobium sp.]
MRVAIDFTPGLNQPAGIGRYTRELVRALAEQAHFDIVLWHGRTSSPRPRPSSPRIHYRQMPFSERWLTRLWYRLRIPFPIDPLIGPVDVVHGTDFLVPQARCARVATVHDVSFLLVPELGHPRLVSFLRAVVPRMLRTADALITVSESVQQDLLRLYRVAPDRVYAIPHGVAFPFVPHQPQHARPVIASLGIREPYVIAVGTVEPRKGYPVLLQAVERAAENIPDLQLVIVGATGWLAEPIERALEEAQQRGRVFRLRRISDQTLAALYSAAAAFVTASFYEGFNFPLLEALACGAPAIATDIPVHREVAGNAALFVRSGDVDSLAEAMISLLTDTTLARRLQQAGPQQASRFSWHKSAEQHIAVYRAVASEHANRRA